MKTISRNFAFHYGIIGACALIFAARLLNIPYGVWSLTFLVLGITALSILPRYADDKAKERP